MDGTHPAMEPQIRAAIQAQVSVTPQRVAIAKGLIVANVKA
jgi:hypothetical protein